MQSGKLATPGLETVQFSAQPASSQEAVRMLYPALNPLVDPEIIK